MLLFTQRQDCFGFKRTAPHDIHCMEMIYLPQKKLELQLGLQNYCSIIPIDVGLHHLFKGNWNCTSFLSLPCQKGLHWKSLQPTVQAEIVFFFPATHLFQSTMTRTAKLELQNSKWPSDVCKVCSWISPLTSSENSDFYRSDFPALTITAQLFLSKFCTWSFIGTPDPALH